ncbi:hypothetical protein Y032_0070g448 [Ancylostoma ceylanicum]|uniref:Uncharacterized protein n=1 Tax=Ancylostoma ceylanicum TaxID=53326 RepID=A0A016TYR1_9BILA|nr:hypothetical protein Y032_0070g448 [Ancylostoma ceylanicum]
MCRLRYLCRLENLFISLQGCSYLRKLQPRRAHESTNHRLEAYLLSRIHARVVQCIPSARETQKSIISFLEGFRKEVISLGRWSSCRALDAPWSPVADCSTPTVVAKVHDVFGPPDLT